MPVEILHKGGIIGPMRLTQHAIKRSQQRGIPEDAIDAIVTHGRRRYSKKGLSYMMDRHARIKASTAMGESAYRELEPWLDSYVIVSLDRASIITTAWEKQKKA